jgi:hypothetical protein
MLWRHAPLLLGAALIATLPVARCCNPACVLKCTKEYESTNQLISLTDCYSRCPGCADSDPLPMRPTAIQLVIEAVPDELILAAITPREWEEAVERGRENVFGGTGRPMDAWVIFLNFHFILNKVAAAPWSTCFFQLFFFF